MTVQRSRREISDAYIEYRDKVWWHHPQARMEELEDGKIDFASKILTKALKAEERIERQYGTDDLGVSDFHFGLLFGRMSAHA